MDMNPIQALTKLIRSLTDHDLSSVDEDHLAALSIQIPRLSARIVKELQGRGLLEKPRENPGINLFGGGQ